MLDKSTNYIVSGLERSGTSVMMQMLNNGGVPIAYDESRPADEHNPNGYFELAGGKIINRLIDGTFDIEAHRGMIVKVTAYGLKFIPAGKYRIIYMLRNINEVLNSMLKMGAEINMKKDRTLFNKLNNYTLELMDKRHDMEYITIFYNDVVQYPAKEIEKVEAFLGTKLDRENAVQAVDSKLYRNRVGS